MSHPPSLYPPSGQACRVAADVQQGKAVVLVMHPGVNQAESQDLHAVGRRATHAQAHTAPAPGICYTYIARRAPIGALCCQITQLTPLA